MSCHDKTPEYEVRAQKLAATIKALVIAAIESENDLTGCQQCSTLIYSKAVFAAWTHIFASAHDLNNRQLRDFIIDCGGIIEKHSRGGGGWNLDPSQN